MTELKKSLGFWMVASIAFLNLVNTGIFFGMQVGARAGYGGTIAGIDSLIAWALLAIISIYVAMCFGELTSMFPAAGGIYEFAKQGYGRFTSFIIAWSLWVTGNIATALFTVAAAQYILPTTPITIMGIIIAPALLKILLCIIAIIALNYIAYRGIEASARFILALSIFMILLITYIIAVSIHGIHYTNYTGFTFNTSIILIAVFFLSETFFGWEAASFMSEETEDAAHVIPKAIIWSTVAVAIIALLLTTITIGVLGIQKIVSPATTKPIIDMLAQVGVTPLILAIVNIGIVAALLGNVSGNIVSMPRLLLAMSRDKLFIEQFSEVHPTRQTPYKAIIFQTIVAILIVIVGAANYQSLLELIIPVSLAIYCVTLVLIPHFRKTKPDHPRPYKVPGGTIIPWFVAGFFFTLLILWAFTEPEAFGLIRMLFSFLLFSIPIYLTLTYFYDPDSLISTLSFFSKLSLWLENFIVPRRVRREALEFLTNAKDKNVLEFGSGVGTFTVHLADHVGKNGKVYAVELSRANVEIIKRRMDKLGNTHVQVIHDPHFISRVHPDVHNVDIVVSINNLSYIQDIKKVLSDMNNVLTPRGRIYFVEYIDLFYFLPNPKWLDDPEKVRELFHEAGFTVRVHIRRGLLWKYLYIYGIKQRSDATYI